MSQKATRNHVAFADKLKIVKYLESIPSEQLKTLALGELIDMTKKKTGITITGNPMAALLEDAKLEYGRRILKTRNELSERIEDLEQDLREVFTRLSYDYVIRRDRVTGDGTGTPLFNGE